MLDQVTGAVVSSTGNGGYDQDSASAEVAVRHPSAALIVLPRATAVPSATAETAPTRRDRHLRFIAEHGRTAWQKAFGYTTLTRAEAPVGRFKRVIGDGPCSRTDERRATGEEMAAYTLDPCWISDARPTSASPDPKRGWGYRVLIPRLCNTSAGTTNLPCRDSLGS